MNSKEVQADTIDLLKKHEEAINQLYDTFAWNFPDHGTFWASLSGDELHHATMINTLIPKIREGSVDFNENRFKIEAIQNSLNYIEDILATASEGDMSHTNALSIALDIERGMIEKKFFTAFDEDSADLMHVLSVLEAETRKHVESIERAWTNNR